MTSPSFPLPGPGDLARLLPPDVSLDGRGLRHEAARPVWLGVVWSRLGRADLAWQVWDRIGAPEVQPWLAAERGRVLREFGLHSEAERLEWRAFATATDPADRAMLQISLTADAVGRGDVPMTTRRFAAAEDAVRRLPDGSRAARQRLRLGWVAVEVAMVTSRSPAAAFERPAAEIADDLAHGSAFHRAKQRLFEGLTAGSLTLLDEAVAEDVPILTWAIHLARADLGADDALSAARSAWADIHYPPGFATKIRATPTAQRLDTPPQPM